MRDVFVIDLEGWVGCECTGNNGMFGLTKVKYVNGPSGKWGWAKEVGWVMEASQPW